MNIEYFFSKKQRILFISLAVIGVLTSILVGVFAEEFELTANLDDNDYFRNQTVTVTGIVPLSNNTDAKMEIWILQKNIWYDRAVLDITNSSFTHTFAITDAWEKDGAYTMSIQYEGQDLRIPFSISVPKTAEELAIEEIIDEMIELENNSTSTEPIVNATLPTNSTTIEPISNQTTSEPAPEPIVIIPEIIEPITNSTAPTNNTETIPGNETSTEVIEEFEQVQTNSIPSWVKEVFKMWASDQISDQELLNGIRYLININVIVVS